MRDLGRAVALHDIGKLSISNRILDKPGPLTDAELEKVREHPLVTREDPGAGTGFQRPRGTRQRPSRAPRRQRLPTRADGSGADDADAGPGGRRRLRGVDRRAPVPPGVQRSIVALEIMRTDVP